MTLSLRQVSAAVVVVRYYENWALRLSLPLLASISANTEPLEANIAQQCVGEPQVGDPGSSCSPSLPGIAGCGALSLGRQQNGGWQPRKIQVYELKFSSTCAE
jgi:hypothetical protein